MCVTINETHESFLPLAFTAAALSLSIVGAKVASFTTHDLPVPANGETSLLLSGCIEGAVKAFLYGAVGCATLGLSIIGLTQIALLGASGEAVPANCKALRF